MKKHAAVILCLVFLCIFSYANTLKAPFLFDDNPNIVDNPMTKDLSNFVHLSQARQFTESTGYPMLVKRYVSLLSLALNYHVNGLDTTGYHVINIIIHILNTLLVYALVILTFRTPFMNGSRIVPYTHWAGLLAAALFATHPVQTQAVTYIVQRMASLATLFYVASLTSYVRSRLSERKREKITFYILALVCSVLGMKSKEIVFTLPLAIALYEWAFLEGPRRKRFVLWLPMGLTMLIIPLTLLAIGGARVLGNEALKIQDISRIHYLLTEARVAVTYLRLLSLPVGQVLNYNYPLYKSILEPQVLASFFLHMSFFLAAVWLYMHSRKGEPALRLIAFGICWFYLTLSVESTFIPLFVIFEHRLYLPSVGIFIGASTGVLLLISQARHRWFTRTAIIAITVVPLMLAVLTVSRNSLWRNEEHFYQDEVLKAPGHILNHINLGNTYYDEGRLNAAITQFKTAIVSKPYAYGPKRLREPLAMAYFNLGNVYKDQGKMDKAARQWEHALKVIPNYTEALNHLGNYYILKGNYPKAITYLKKAIQYDPRNFEALYNLAVAYENVGMMDEAAHAYQQFIVMAPPGYEDAVRSAREKLRSWKKNGR